MSFIHVIKSGMQSSVQDLGRHGYRHAGVPSCGVFDRDAHLLGNLLLGNDPNDASIEMTLDGGSFEVQGECWICLSGAPMRHAQILTNDRVIPIPHLRPVRVEDRSRVQIGPIEDGMRGYICIAGGVSTERVLGSRSSLVSNPNAGLGQALRTGATLPIGKHTGSIEEKIEIHARRASDAPIRIVKSHHTSQFSDMQIQQLADGAFCVSTRSNRTGIRLDEHSIQGPLPELRQSVGTLPGYIQIPPDGNPIILGVDGPVTGGYPVIGCVIEADLGRVAQLRPNTRVRFKLIDREDPVACPAKSKV